MLFSVVPFLPGFRWHRVARGWRTPGIGELLMGATTRWGFRRELPAELADAAWDAFDHGTQRAILKLYRSAPPEVLARAGERLGEIRAPALVLWPEDDPYIGAEVRPGSTPTRSAARPPSRWSAAATGRGSETPS